MNKMLKMAITLSAYDRMSRVVFDATSKSEKSIKHLKSVAKDNLSKGLIMGGGAATIGASVKPVIDAYADLEDASLKLKSVMLRDGNKINEKMFQQVNAEAIRLGNLLPGTTADFQNLFATMQETGVSAQSIINGTGEAAAYLAVQLEMGTEEAGKLAGKLKNAMGIPDKDMMKMMDFMARMKNVNVEAGEMQYAFAKSSMALKGLGVQGLENSKLIGNLFAQMISTGQTGETVGTNFGRILQEIANPTKLAKFTELAKQYGVDISLFDKKGSFKGIGNFITQFSKFNGIDIVSINKILEPLTGDQGVDSGFLNALAMSGAKSFNEMNKRLFEQATLIDKVNLRLGSLRNMWEATVGTFVNFLATVADPWKTEMKAVVHWMGAASAKAQEFGSSHPKLLKIVTGVTLVTMALLSLNATIAVTRGAWALMAAHGILSLSGLEFSLFAFRYHMKFSIWPAITGAATAMWGWATSMWAGAIPALSAMITATWAWAAALWATGIPQIVIAVVALGAAFVIAYKHSEKFRAVIAGIMEIGKLLVSIFSGLGKIIMGTFSGNFKMMKEGLAQSATAMFKFTNPTALITTFREGYDKSLASEKATATPSPVQIAKPVPVAQSGFGGNTIYFSPVVNLHGSATKEDGEKLNGSMKDQFDKMMKDYQARNKRSAF